MRTRRTLLGSALALVMAAFACNALSGADDLDVDEASRVDAASADATGNVPEASPADASADVVVDAPADSPSLPSYCTGLAFYVPFEGTMISAEGISPGVDGTFGAGKFDSGADLSASTTLFYYPVDATRYQVAVGTVAMWVKTAWTPPDPSDRVLFKPRATNVATATLSAGPYIQNIATVGMVGVVDLPDGGLVHSPPITAGWVSGTFNHLVLRWNQATPRLSLSLNAAPASTTTTGWTPIEPTVAFLRLNSGGSASQGAFDDWAVWNRELSDPEVSALYASGVSLATACKR